MYDDSFEFHDVSMARNNLIQLTIEKLRDWVFDREEPFTINDIYLDTNLSKGLCVNAEMVKSVRTSLIRLGCSILSTHGFIETFKPPGNRRIDRDLLIS